MADMDNLERQHSSIRDYVKEIMNLIGKNDFPNDANEIARVINTLSGRLKIHLQAEDQFLYPKLLKSENIEIRKTTENYIKEMGNISTVFENYKNQFNTKSKICINPDFFKLQTQEVFGVLEKRLDKEDGNLYPLVKNHG